MAAEKIFLDSALPAFAATPRVVNALNLGRRQVTVEDFRLIEEFFETVVQPTAGSDMRGLLLAKVPNLVAPIRGLLAPTSRRCRTI
jgi:hypothetical protein